METKEELWARRIAEYKASGKPVRIFCEENGIGISGMKYWLDKRKASKKPMPEPVQTKPANMESAAGWLTVQEVAAQASGIMLEIGDVKIRVESGFDQSLLREVLNVVSIC